ncbi:hypothetical protein FQN54_000297 [Arachnomyces sp. PD_36]|nr:hypothetical protein FQN54_000297 [Arachnomyces sp. PD_36]
MRLPRGLVPLITSALSLFTYNVDARSQARDSINYLSLVENVQINHPSHRIHAHSHFDLTFNLHQKEQRLKFSLQPNDDIFAEDAQVQYLDVDGNVRKTESIDRRAHKVFKGSTYALSDRGNWDRVGWARITVRRDGSDPLFEGAFTVMHEQHHVRLRSNYMRTKHELDPHLEDTDDEYMVVFRDSDFRQQPHIELKRSLSDSPACGSDALDFNAQPGDILYPQELKRSGIWGAVSTDSLFGFSKRQEFGDGLGGNSGIDNLESTIGDTSGCPGTRKVALIGVVTDCTYTASFNSSDAAKEKVIDDTRSNVIDVVNSASSLFESSFNITLGLRNLVVSDPECPATAPEETAWNMPCSTSDVSTRLDLFSTWRSKRDDDNAYWTLMSDCRTGAEVGLAYVGQLCKGGVEDGASGSGSNFVAKTPTEWQVFAHESGHTFGAVHDCDELKCESSTAVANSECCPLDTDTCDANEQFIMNPSSNSGITQFSPCTIGNICSAMGRGSVKTTCLSENRGVVTITGSECGNGIVEEGEDCDCGNDESCAGNTCCDAKTCKYASGAVCDDANEDCCRDCQFASSNTVCRASTGECDPEELCTGDTSICPNDVQSPDGDSCGDDGDGLTCASGECTSRDMQCASLMGTASGATAVSCNDDSCSLSCKSRSFEDPNGCYILPQNFLDGTPCNAGGRCNSGSCQGSSFGKEVQQWVEDNKNLVIGLSVGVGCLVIFMFACCIFRRCRRPKAYAKPPRNRRRSRRGGPPIPPAPPPVGQNAWSTPWSNAAGYWQRPQDQGYGNASNPAFPPPAYGTTNAAQGRMPTMRYA